MIISFYSYKGGAGRTMALVNVGVALAQSGKRVLIVDLDLEAPGADGYLRDLPAAHKSVPEGEGGGVLEYFEPFMHGKPQQMPWIKFTRTAKLPGGASIRLMPTGRRDQGYNERVLSFDWVRVFEGGGGDEIERLRQIWNEEFDQVLVDSRTGITDTAGVSLVHLPDVIVPVFNPNEDSLAGAVATVDAAQNGRAHLVKFRGEALVLPLASRIDDRTEYKRAKQWLARCSEQVKHYYASWLPKEIDPLDALERTKLPYVSYYSFGSELPVLNDSASDVASLGYSIRTVANLIDREFTDVKELFAPNLAFSSEIMSRRGLDSAAFAGLTDEELNVAARVLVLNDRGLGTAQVDDDESVRTLQSLGLVKVTGGRITPTALLHEHADVEDYVRRNDALLTWSTAALRSAQRNPAFILDGESLKTALTLISESPGLLTPFERRLVEASLESGIRPTEREPLIAPLRVIPALLGLSVPPIVGAVIAWLIRSPSGYVSPLGWMIGSIVSALLLVLLVNLLVVGRIGRRHLLRRIDQSAGGNQRRVAFELQEMGYLTDDGYLFRSLRWPSLLQSFVGWLADRPSAHYPVAVLGGEQAVTVMGPAAVVRRLEYKLNPTARAVAAVGD